MYQAGKVEESSGTCAGFRRSAVDKRFSVLDQGAARRFPVPHFKNTRRFASICRNINAIEKTASSGGLYFACSCSRQRPAAAKLGSAAPGPAAARGDRVAYLCAGARLDHGSYTDSYLREILDSVRTIAMVGASDQWNRPSFFVMKYLQGKGYRIVPVNPRAAGGEILGERVYATLADVPDKIDMVDVFRNAEAAGPITDAAIAIGAKVVWMQLGIVNAAAAARAEAAGLKVVMNRCPKIEWSRLNGELAWSGVNTGIISSKRQKKV
jgi:predicted CoA-binding protein